MATAVNAIDIVERDFLLAYHYTDLNCTGASYSAQQTLGVNFLNFHIVRRLLVSDAVVVEVLGDESSGQCGTATPDGLDPRWFDEAGGGAAYFPLLFGKFYSKYCTTLEQEGLAEQLQGTQQRNWLVAARDLGAFWGYADVAGRSPDGSCRRKLVLLTKSHEGVTIHYVVYLPGNQGKRLRKGQTVDFSGAIVGVGYLERDQLFGMMGMTKKNGIYIYTVAEELNP